MGIPLVGEPPVSFGGQLWIADQILRDAGYANPREFDVVLIQGKYYELAGRVKKQSDTPGWWITPVTIPEIDWPSLTEFEYEELEKKRGRRA